MNFIAYSGYERQQIENLIHLKIFAKPILILLFQSIDMSYMQLCLVGFIYVGCRRKKHRFAANYFNLFQFDLKYSTN